MLAMVFQTRKINYGNRQVFRVDREQVEAIVCHACKHNYKNTDKAIASKGKGHTHTDKVSNTYDKQVEDMSCQI